MIDSISNIGHGGEGWVSSVEYHKFNKEDF